MGLGERGCNSLALGVGVRSIDTAGKGDGKEDCILTSPGWFSATNDEWLSVVRDCVGRLFICVCVWVFVLCSHLAKVFSGVAEDFTIVLHLLFLGPIQTLARLVARNAHLSRICPGTPSPLLSAPFSCAATC